MTSHKHTAHGTVGNEAAQKLIEWAAQRGMSWIQLNQILEEAVQRVAIASLDHQPDDAVSAE